MQKATYLFTHSIDVLYISAQHKCLLQIDQHKRVLTTCRYTILKCVNLLMLGHLLLVPMHK